jgi:hypothetical protein
MARRFPEPSHWTLLVSENEAALGGADDPPGNRLTTYRITSAPYHTRQAPAVGLRAGEARLQTVKTN